MFGIVAAAVLVLSALYYGGVIVGLLFAAAAGYCLKHFGVVGADSAWVSETKGVKVGKYILLAIIAMGLILLYWYLNYQL